MKVKIKRYKELPLSWARDMMHFMGKTIDVTREGKLYRSSDNWLFTSKDFTVIGKPKTTAKKQVKKPKGYLCNPKFNNKRLPNTAYADRDKVTSKWQAIKRPEGLSTCVNPNYNLEAKTYEFAGNSYNNPKHIGMYQVISSAFLLYKLLTLFKAPVKTEGPDGYKCIWWVTLQHKDTKEVLQFGEWKGAAGIWTEFHAHEELHPTYEADLLELLNYICSPKTVHPYDGLVAGSVA